MFQNTESTWAPGVEQPCCCQDGCTGHLSPSAFRVRTMPSAAHACLLSLPGALGGCAFYMPVRETEAESLDSCPTRFTQEPVSFEGGRGPDAGLHFQQGWNEYHTSDDKLLLRGDVPPGSGPAESGQLGLWSVLTWQGWGTCRQPLCDVSSHSLCKLQPSLSSCLCLTFYLRDGRGPTPSGCCKDS